MRKIRNFTEKLLTSCKNFVSCRYVNSNPKTRRLPLNVTIIYGPAEYPFQLGTGCTVQSFYDEHGFALGIPDDAQAVVNGSNVERSQVLRANDRVEFRKATGRKG